MAYNFQIETGSREDAIRSVEALALRALADNDL